MGLDIKTYSYSYHVLHLIRQEALYCEGNNIDIFKFYSDLNAETSFPQLINHSDCDGVYVSKTSKQYDKLKRKYSSPHMFGDLDKLKEECIRLNEYMNYKDENNIIIDAWNDFYDDVMTSRKVLRFM